MHPSLKHYPISRWTELAIISAGIASLFIPAEAEALSDQKRLERLERHIMELERRLEASEAENARLRVQTDPAPKNGGNKNNNSSTTSTTAVSPEVKALDQKVRLLERKMEIDKETAENARKTTPKVEAGPSTGFRITSADGENQLRLRGFVQADGDFFKDDVSTGDAAGVGVNGATGQPVAIQPGNGLGVDKFLIRRARLQFAGTLFKYADFLVAPDFGQGQARLFDATLDLHYFRFASLAVGKQKAPISLERIQAAPNTLFAERAYPTQLAPNRDIGVMLHGEFAKPGYDPQYTFVNQSPEFFSYQLGVFNGTLDNQAVQNSDNTTFNNKAFDGRIFSHPFQHSGIDLLEGFGLGLAGTFASPQRATPIPTLVSPGQNNIVTYNTSNPTLTSSSLATAVTATNTPGTGKQTTTTTTTTNTTSFSGAMSNGDLNRIYPQGYWYWGPLGVFWEYSRSSQNLAVQQTNTTTTSTSTAIRTNTAPGTTTTVNRTSVSASSSKPTMVNQTPQTNQAWQIALSLSLIHI